MNEDICENQNAMHIDWMLGEVFTAPCTNPATCIIVDEDGHYSLCDECAEKKIGKIDYDE